MRLRLALADAGVSVREVSRRTDVRESRIRDWLRGGTEPGALALARVSVALREAGVAYATLDYLLGLTDLPGGGL